MDSRLTLHEELCKILGSRNVYFNTPESVKMKYPAIRYSLSDLDNRSASNEVYIQRPTYSLTLIDKDPDSPVAKKLSVLSGCKLSRPPYPANGLYHFPFTLKTTNGNISDVLTEQYNQGYADCEQNYSDVAARVEQAYEAGRRNAWGFIQGYGERTAYDYGFYRLDLTDFYPMFDIKPTLATFLFRDSEQHTPEPYDLVERLEECGVTIDLSNCTSVTYCFYKSAFTHLPVLDFRNAGDTTKNLGCGGEYTRKIDKIILTEDGQPLSDYFSYAYSLEEVEIEGSIAGGSLNIKNSPKLTLDSLKSILTALKDYSGTTNEYSYTVTLRSENWAVLEADGATAPNGMTWVEYISAKGWNNA